MSEAQYTIAPWRPLSFIISGDGGRPLLTIHPDGAVTSEIEDASEAARVFVDYVRQNTRQPAPTDDWQPIDTAPPGQVPLILWAKREGDPTFRQVCGWRYSGMWAVYGCGKSQECLDVIQPTHWRTQHEPPR